MKSIVRNTILALSLLAAGTLKAQTITFQQVPWGEPRARVLSRLDAMGYTLRDEADDKLFLSSPTGGSAIAVFDARSRLVAVMSLTQGTSADMRARYRQVTDSLRARFGPPTLGGDTLQSWEGDDSGVTVVVSGPVEWRAAWAVNVLHTGPGYASVRDADLDDDRAGGFAPLDASRWLIGYRGSDRRIAIDRTRVTPLGNDVYRVWERWESAEPLRDSQGEWYDSNLTQVDYDCRGTRTRVLEIVTYYRGRVLDSVDVPASRQAWESIVPESVGERTLRTVCPVLRALR